MPTELLPRAAGLGAMILVGRDTDATCCGTGCGWIGEPVLLGGLESQSSIDFIRHGGGAVLDAHLSFRSAYMAALTVGKAGPEVDKSPVARKEIDALWAEVLATLNEKVAA